MEVEPAMRLAERAARRLGEIDGVVAVALGGSRARGEARPDSDLDLGIYYDPERPPPVADLRALARELDDRGPEATVTDFGEWGPWINGGGWMRIEGRPVDWLYRDLDLVSRVVEECMAGRTSCHYQPGHPHGFHTHIYAGEVHHCVPLYDPDGRLSALRSLTYEYPPALKESVARKHLWEARFALETCRKPADRGDAFYVAGCLFRCAACLVQVLFALNERYFVNEKGSVEVAASFAVGPERFGETVAATLSRPGQTPAELRASIGGFERLVRETEELCAGSRP